MQTFMNNILEFNGGYRAVISYDPKIELFRGEFVGLNGGADFYATDMGNLKKEGEKSLTIFLEECKDRKMFVQKLVDGEKSAQEKGWISFEEVLKILEVSNE